MVNVIGVRFQNAGKLYFFDPGTLWPTPGDFVVVETSRGVEFGEVVTPVQEINDEQLESPLKKVIRIASAQDVQHAKDNKEAEKEAYAICQKKIGEHKLDMKLVSVEYTFDNSKILFYFTANGRVDFRSLVKDLAGVFKTRIELRQIGVRDEAKMLGGLGPCGRSICCGTFLGDFQPVSIKMAKEQNLSLNPIKISGVCGRLMCCLKYEQDTYEQTRKRMPRIGREVKTPDGYGTVVDLNIIKESVRVRIMKGDASELKDYTLETLQAMAGENGAQAQSDIGDQAGDSSEPESEAIESETVREESAEKPPVHGEQRMRNTRERPRRERMAKPAAEPSQSRQAADADQTAGNDGPEREAAVESAQKAESVQAERSAEAPKASAGAWKAALERALHAAQDSENGEQS